MTDTCDALREQISLLQEDRTTIEARRLDAARDSEHWRQRAVVAEQQLVDLTGANARLATLLGTTEAELASVRIAYEAASKQTAELYDALVAAEERLAGHHPQNPGAV